MRVGVDVGGTSIRAGLFGVDESRRVEAPTSARGGAELAHRIHQTVIALVGADLAASVSGVGVGVPGLVDVEGGTVRHAVNLGIDGTPYPLRDRLSAALGLPVIIDNDVRAAAAGAHAHLLAGGEAVSDLVYLGVGTGIAAGVVIGGRLHRGRRGAAGEIGHAPLAGDVRCRCGLVGCLESVAGGRAIAADSGGDAETLFSSPSSAPAVRVATALARAVQVLAAAYDPDVVVLGGGIGPHAAPAVRTALARLSEGSPFGEVLLSPERVITLPPDVDVGTAGAALLVQDPTTAPNPTGR